VLVRRIELVDPEMQQRLGSDGRRSAAVGWTGAKKDVPEDARLLFTARSGPDGRIAGLDAGFAADLAPGLLPVPSLSERPGDAAELAARFVCRALRARGLGASTLGLTEVGRALFERASWEGGVAQLEQVVEELLDRRLRSLRADATRAADAMDQGPEPVDLATIRALALAG
jgi:transcriptional regulator with AAA-type ATPase domain